MRHDSEGDPAVVVFGIAAGGFVEPGAGDLSGVVGDGRGEPFVVCDRGPPRRDAFGVVAPAAAS